MDFGREEWWKGCLGREGNGEEKDGTGRGAGKGMVRVDGTGRGELGKG